MSEQRRERLRLEISRAAARLFWDQGVTATSGEQIAEAVGVSVRTIWRHFRTKESCAEPLVARSVAWFTEVLREWPEQSTLEDHLLASVARRRREAPASAMADEVLATRMVALADTEPALRTAWLMACDQVEHEMATIIAARTGRPVNDVEGRLHAAAAASAVRVMDEHIGAALLAEAGPAEFRELTGVSTRLAHMIRTATGGAVGDPVA